MLDFLKQVFGAEVSHPPTPDESGRCHSELKVGDSMLLLGLGYFSDPSMAAVIWIYVKDVDATYKHALRADATSLREPADQTWGDRVCGVKDSSGNARWIATHTVSR